MPDERSPEDRLHELSGRRADDSGSRGFLQLAEEHRRDGRIEEAIEVLQEGLTQHPSYVSAQVALGRCWLELDHPERARRVLDKVVDQDVTHLVAAKLLVETHIRRSDPAQARRQLDLYGVLNNTDPDIEPLRKRIEALGGSEGAEPAGEAQPAPQSAVGPRGAEAGWSAPSGGTGNGGTRAASKARGELAEPFPFSRLEERQRRYRRGLASEDLFPLSAAWLAALAEPEPAAASAPIDEPASEPESEEPTAVIEAPAALLAAEGWEASEVATPETGPDEVVDRSREGLEPASERELGETVTLGQLYLEQGHDTEAERIFREVLDREPANEAARQGLATLQQRAAALPSPAAEIAETFLEDEDEPLAAAAPGAGLGGAVTGSVLERKKILLTRYLELLRQSPERDVS